MDQQEEARGKLVHVAETLKSWGSGVGHSPSATRAMAGEEEESLTFFLSFYYFSLVTRKTRGSDIWEGRIEYFFLT